MGVYFTRARYAIGSPKTVGNRASGGGAPRLPPPLDAPQCGCRHLSTDPAEVGARHRWHGKPGHPADTGSAEAAGMAQIRRFRGEGRQVLDLTGAYTMASGP